MAPACTNPDDVSNQWITTKLAHASGVSMITVFRNRDLFGIQTIKVKTKHSSDSIRKIYKLDTYSFSRVSNNCPTLNQIYLWIIELKKYTQFITQVWFTSIA
jgi:hypothetical protein